jgi:hypothetical protein
VTFVTEIVDSKTNLRVQDNSLRRLIEELLVELQELHNYLLEAGTQRITESEEG